MKILKIILNIILSFFLTIVILGMVVLNIASKTILSKDYVINQMNEKEFYTQISREVQNGMEDYMYQSGMPEEVFLNIYTDDMIKKDIDAIIEYIYEGTEITTSEEIVRENLMNNINEEIKKQGVTLNVEAKKSIELFKDLIVNRYIDNVNFSVSNIDIVKTNIEKIEDIYIKVKNVPLIALIVILVLLIVINIKSMLSPVNMVSISFISVGILLKIVEYVITKNISIDNIMILSISLSNMISSTARDVIYLVSNYGTTFLIIGTTGIIICSMIKASNYKTNNS